MPLRKAAKATLLFTGHYRRRLAGVRFPGVVVLCYHAVRPDAAPEGSYPFEQLHVRVSELAAHCALLSRCCTPISLDDLRQAVLHGALLPPRAGFHHLRRCYRSGAMLAAPRSAVPRSRRDLCLQRSIADRRLLWPALARRGAETDVERVKRLTFAEWQRTGPRHLLEVSDDIARADDRRASSGHVGVPLSRSAPTPHRIRSWRARLWPRSASRSAHARERWKPDRKLATAFAH